MFNRLLRVVTLLVWFFLIMAAGAETPKQRTERFLKFGATLGSTYSGTYKAAGNLKFIDRVSDEQAWLLARAYFYDFISLCGGVDLPLDKGQKWLFTTAVGIGGRPGPKIWVDKKSGDTWSPGKVRVTDRRIYLKIRE